MKRFLRLCLLLSAAALLSGCPGQNDQSATNSIGMEFVLIPAGSFTMGADKNSEDAAGHETPQHRVTISQPFYLGKYEVTQREWEAVMGGNPSKFKGQNNPV
jgi:formylglycine-generating enzyme required for sulfatase activity